MRKFAVWGALGIVTVFVVYLVGAGLVFNQILNRILVVGVGTDLAAQGQPDSSPYDLGYRGDPQVAFGYAFEDVLIATDNGNAPAWLVTPEGAASQTWAIFVHGIAGSREGGYRYLPSLHAAGYPTLMITYRNDVDAPKSAEGIYSFGLTEWPDLDAAVAHALANGAQDVVIAADSMGGGVLGQFLLHSERRDSVKAVLMDAPALDFPEVANWVGRDFPIAPLVSNLGERFFAFQHGVNLRDARVLPVLAAFAGPIMLVHGSGDRIVPVTISEQLLEMRYGTTLFLRSHGDHLQTRAEDPERYDRALQAFLASL